MEFLPLDVKCILSIPLQEATSHDEIVQQYEKKRTFTVHIAYALAVTLSTATCLMEGAEDWKFIWNARVPRKIQMLHGDVKDSNCSCCRLVLEDLSRILVSCTFAHLICALSNLP
ncbi:UNVERIFIED_CONTAM: hypothetical protein Sangu_2158900 [Sesamum angustifolium]|uniref:Reverse transcriptase zinc-binding domain-containing protein n=1 Tax=Sesamum angustifolium TaxID=2727405 RepID=A0AAW2LEI2_9LAMI